MADTNTPQTSTIRITYTPARVAVSDERAYVDGWAVSIAYPSGTVQGTMIPQEGQDRSAWLGSLADEPEAVICALEEQASEVAVVDLLEAEEFSDGWAVRDLVDGGSLWWPNEEAATEINAAGDPKETATRICAAEAHRGEWFN